MGVGKKIGGHADRRVVVGDQGDLQQDDEGRELVVGDGGQGHVSGIGGRSFLPTGRTDRRGQVEAGAGPDLRDLVELE